MADKEKYFIPIEGKMIEVEENVYIAYYKMGRRERYLEERDKDNGVLSYDALDHDGMIGEEMFQDPGTHSPEDIALAKELLDQLQRCIEMLPRAERELIQAIYFGMSIPNFYFGILLIILFTAKLHWLPSSGMHTYGVDTFLDTAKHMIMPVMTMALGSMASKVRYVRANTIGQLAEEYVLAAKAKGTPPIKILFRHVLKNTLLPIITIVGMNMASLVCGSFIIESVFGWPGVGSFAMEAIGKRDYPVIMAYILLSGFILVMGNFVADILYSFADPRIKRRVDVANGK